MIPGFVDLCSQISVREDQRGVTCGLFLTMAVNAVMVAVVPAILTALTAAGCVFSMPGMSDKQKHIAKECSSTWDLGFCTLKMLTDQSYGQFDMTDGVRDDEFTIDMGTSVCRRATEKLCDCSRLHQRREGNERQ